MTFTIRVPGSSANVGPGFDTLGLAVRIYLTIYVTVNSQAPSSAPFNCMISYDGEDAEKISLDPKVNLITRMALYVLKSHHLEAFPVETLVHIKNMIPLSRGLGSSAAAVVAGAVLANEVGGLGLDKARILDYCLVFEPHPDNVAAAVYGGFVGAYVDGLRLEDVAQNIGLQSEVLPTSPTELDILQMPNAPPIGISHCENLPLAKEIKALVVIPDFEVPTSKARDVLPKSFTREDVVFNLQRAVVLLSALARSPPDPNTIYSAMRDRIHEPYRNKLIPGLTEVLHSISPNTQPGFLGICLSGAGPTILVLATSNFSDIAERIIDQFKCHGVSCTWKLLEPDLEGATVERTGSILTPAEI